MLTILMLMMHATEQFNPFDHALLVVYFQKDEAILRAKELAETEPSAIHYRQLGDVYVHHGDLFNAYEAYHQAFSLSNDLLYVHNMIWVLSEIDVQKASRLIHHLNDIDPGSYMIHIHQARVCHFRRDFDKAERLLNEVREQGIEIDSKIFISGFLPFQLLDPDLLRRTE